MSLSPKTVKRRLALFKPLLDSSSLDMIRFGQEKIGAVMHRSGKLNVVIKEHYFEAFNAAWIIPRDERRQGVLLYLHGGGYTAGDMEYAKGVGTTLAVQTATKVFAPAYRLAPENSFPAALDDSLEAYKYLVSKGYDPDKITLIGESAGGGLCYSLLVRLRELGMAMPAGVIAISAWTDLTASAESYETNKKSDPTISKKLLDFYADAYTTDRNNPLVSPLFASLEGICPSLIFVGGDEILLDDSVRLHEKLKDSGNISQLIVKKDRWHAYLLFKLNEDRDDFTKINAFLDKYMSKADRLRWLKLDNAAKIYPAARRQNWSNIFRVSVTLKENIDTAVLASALDVTVRRFPSFSTRLCKGVFWYYLEQISSAPEIMDENSFPLSRMTKKDISTCAFRVIVYKSRIAVELFHSLTDGTGAMIFLKTLTAEYLQQKYGISITAGNGVLPRLEEPDSEEFEDSFQKYAGKVNASRRESNAWHLKGTVETAGFLNLTCFKLNVKQALDKAHEYNATLTEFLTAVMMWALSDLQKEKVLNPKQYKPVKVLVPVNLRNIFESRTMRNFALYTTPEIDLRLGDYTFEEICRAVHHRMGLDVNRQAMSSKIATNVNSERSPFVKIMPLFIKNIVMKAVFDAVGEKKSCITLSNLGRVSLPDEMVSYVERFDFILGVQATAPNNCGVVSFGDTLYINFIRNTCEPEVEFAFYKALEKLGLRAEVESNSRR